MTTGYASHISPPKGGWSPLLEGAAREVFEVMLKSPLGAGDASAEQNSELIAMVGLTGDLSGFVSVHCSTEAACRMAAKMLNADPQAYNDTARDAVGEVCNMVAGSFKSKLGSAAADCKLSIPFIISGAECVMETNPGGTHVKVPLSFDGSPLVVALDLRN
jgi:chemotaxis protein CheX